MLSPKADCKKVGSHPAQEDIERDLRPGTHGSRAFKSTATDGPGREKDCVRDPLSSGRLGVDEAPVVVDPIGSGRQASGRRRGLWRGCR